MCTRIFLSWCHLDKALKVALLRDLLPALGVFTDLDVEWWEDSHLTRRFTPTRLPPGGRG